MRVLKQRKTRLAQNAIDHLRLILGSALIALTAACGSGLPELRPAIFVKPDKTIEHGRFVEKRYHFYNGPRTVNYAILEIDGKPLRIENGFVDRTSYCEVEGIEAVAFTVKGKGKGVAGFYVIQFDREKQIYQRVCDYKMSDVRWKGAIFSPPCETNWDAKNKKLISWKEARSQIEK
ncbi:MAG: hypothetical protein KDB79_01010 [Acidobacteria bacterium]|nr:hypothetical protein [Acidobacteriota bacterium]